MAHKFQGFFFDDVNTSSMTVAVVRFQGGNGLREQNYQ